MYPTRHALLRDRRSWQTPAWAVSLLGLVADDDGTLGLMRLPRPLQPVKLPPPYDVEPSGLAAAPCLGLFIADSVHGRVLFRDDFCCGTAEVAPVCCDCADGLGFSQPRGLAYGARGLAYGAHGLTVADTGLAQLLRYRVETLRLQGSSTGPYTQPVGVAIDAQGRVVVLDAGVPRVLRLQSHGGPLDPAYTAALAAQLQKPRFIALGAEAVLWVSDAADDMVRRFDVDGAALPPLPPATADWQPRALAVLGTRAYVADARSGLIYAYDGDACLGPVPGYRGPASALAIGDEGSLYIKPGQDEQVIVACASLGSVAMGELRAGPLDAGERTDWERVALDVEVPEGAGVELQVFFSDTALPEPTEPEWIAAPATDLLLSSVATPVVPLAGQARYLWLRVRLRPAADTQGPQLRQVHAATADEDYRQWLPAVFAERDEHNALYRLLALARSEIGGAEALIADLPRLASPDFAPAANLPWLAEWPDFPLPHDLGVARQREVLADAPTWLRKRGTVAGLLSLIHLYTGVRPKLVEWATHRRIWQLGVTSGLGFDTALPAASAEGIVLPDPTVLSKTDPPWGCAAPERIVVGHAVVGVDRPDARTDAGAALFDEHAHRISLFVPPGQASDPALRARLQAVVDAEKPAHVDCDVCFVEADMRIGMNARIGLDAVIAGDGEPMRLAQSELGHDTRLGGTAPPTGTLGQHARIGTGLVLG